MRPLQQPPGGQRLDIAPGGDRGHAEPVRQIGDPYGAALAHQVQQPVMTFSSTFAHGDSPWSRMIEP